jgi:CheY-like chemotaxis protein
MKALVVMPATIEALELCDNLSAQGFAVAHAPSGLYALTLMERDRPDLILAAADVVDMSGRELLAILGEEFQTDVPVILLSDEDAADLPDNAIAVPPGTRVTELLAQAGMLEVEDARPDPHPHNLEHHSPDPMSTLEIEPDEFTQIDWTIENRIEELRVQESHLKAPSQTASMQSASSETVLLPTLESPTQSGQFKFENQGFIYLVRSLANLTAFARIEVRCGTTNGQLYIANGQLIHAEFGRQRGEDAVRGLFLAAADHRGGDFVLHATDPETALRVPATIHRPIHQIVLTWSA